ncbi:MAG: hypothetical protein JW720_10765 [Sedimentisphaerales bacterium]|nr:hypothetical protein [Sedimentisphaerales bacterium]
MSSLDDRSSSEIKVETYDVRFVPLLRHPWKTICIGLDRGEPDYTAYDQRPGEIRGQWDALESFLMNLSRNRHLYVAGSFDAAPEGVENFVLRRRKKYWVGACKINQHAELHEVLISNPTEWFKYVVTDEPFLPEVATKFVDAPVKKHFFEHVVDLCEGVFCIIEENIDRDCFDMACRRDDFDTVLDEFALVLEKCGLKFCPESKHLGEDHGP